MASELEGRLERLRTTPGDRSLFYRLVQDLRTAGREELLAEAYQLHAEAVDGDESVRLWLALAERWSAQDPERRRAAWHEAFQRAWTRRDLFTRMATDVENRGIVEATLMSLQVRLRNETAPRPRARAAADLARLATETQQWELARTSWLELGRADQTQAREALNQLEELRSRGVADRGIEPAIEELARLGQDDRALVRILDTRLVALRQIKPTEFVETCLELAGLTVRITNDPRQAVSYLERALDRSPADAGLIAAWVAENADLQLDQSIDGVRFLRTLAEAASDWQTAAAWLGYEAGLTTDPLVRGEILLRKADLEVSRLGAIEQAVETYTTAAAVSPSLQSIIRERLDRLRRGDTAGLSARVVGAQRAMFEQTGDWGGLHGFLRSELDALPVGERAARWMELAELEMARLGRPDMALRSLAHAAESGEGPTFDAAVQGLFDLAASPSTAEEATIELAAVLQRAERWSELVRLRRRQVDASGDALVRAQLFEELAQLQELKLGRNDEAAISWTRTAELRPGDALAWDQARRLYRALGDLEMVLDLNRRESGLATSADRQLELLVQEIDVLLELQDLPAALETAYEALLEHPANADLQAAFARIIVLEDGMGYVNGLAAEFVQRGDRARAQHILWMAGTKLGLTTDSGATAALLSMQVQPLDLIRLRELRAALDNRNVDKERTPVYQVLAQHGADHDERIAAARELARLLDRAGDIEQAIAAQQMVTDYPFATLADRMALVNLVQKLGDAGALAEAIELIVDDEGLPDEDRLERLRQLARLLDGGATVQGGDAYTRWRQILALRPDDVEALGAIERITATTGDARKLYDALRQTVDELADRAEASRRNIRLAAMAAMDFESPELQLSHFASVVKEATQADPEALDAASAALVAELPPADSDASLWIHAAVARLAFDGDDAPALAGDRIDMLCEAGRVDDGLALARELASASKGANAEILDRAALLLNGAEESDAAAALLERWYSGAPASMPLDRKALLCVWRVLTQEGDATALAAEVLRQEPWQPELLRALEQSEDLGLIAKIGEALSTEDEDVDVLYCAADLLSRADGDTKRAEPLWRTIVDLDGTERRALEALAASLRGRGATDTLRSLLLERVNVTLEEGDRIEFYRQLSELADSASEREDYLRRCASADVQDQDSRRQLAELYRGQERWADLAAVLDELGAAEEDPSLRAGVYRSLAGIWYEKLEDVSKAAAAIEKLLLATPLDVQALQKVESLYRQVEDWKQVAHAIDRRAGLTSNIDERIDLLKELAEICERQLDDLSQAIDALERIISLEPANIRVLEDVARLNAAMERWDAQLRAFERMAGATTIRELQSEVFARAARTMHEKLERHRDAVELLATALEVATPTDTLLDLARAAGSAAELPVAVANILRQVLPRVTSPEQRLSLQLEVATLLNDGADDGSSAIAWLQQCFATSPAPGEILTRLETVAAQRELRSRLTESYRQLIASAEDDDTRWHGFHNLMQIAEEQSGGAEIAFGLMVRAAESVGLRDRAEVELERIAQKWDLWDKHREYLASVSEDAGSTDERIVTILRKAKFEETSMQDWEAAFETLIDAFQDQPEHEALRRELYRMADEHAQWDLVLKLYELLQASTTEVELRVRYLLTMADLCENRIGRAAQGLAHTLRAWRETPDDESLRELLEKRARANDRLVDLVAAYEWHVDEIEDLEGRRSALLRVIQTACDAGMKERALAAWVTLFEYDDTALAELDRCDAWMSANGARGLLGDAIASVLASLRSSETRVAFLLRRAEIAIETQDIDAAVAAWEQAVSLQPTDPTLRRGQADFLLGQQKWAAAARTVEGLAGMTSAPTERTALREEIAEIWSGRMQDPAAAIASLTRLLGSDPDQASAERQIVELYRVLEYWDDLVTFLLEQAQHHRGEPRSVDQRIEAASVVNENLGDARRSLRILDELGADADRVDALELRVRLYGALGRWTDFVEGLGRLAERLEGPAAAAALGQAAEAWENQLVYSDKAVETWRRALLRDPEYVRAYAELGRLLQELGDSEGAFEVLTQGWQLVSTQGATGTDAAEVCTRLALLTDAEGPDAARRMEYLQAAVEADPRHAASREAYELELERSGGIDRLLTLLDEEMQAATSDAERAMVLAKRAAAFFYEGQREADARKALRRATEIQPGLVAAAALLGDIELKAGNAAQALVSWKGLGEDPASLSADVFVRPRRANAEELIDHRVGALYAMRIGSALEQVGQTDAANEVYTGILLDDEAYPPALAALARLSLQRGNTAGAAVHISNYMRYVAQSPRALNARVNLMAARIAEAEGHSSTAMQFYDRVSTLADGDTREAVERAAEIALRSGDASLAVPRLRRLLELTENAAERARITLQLGLAESDAGLDAATGTLALVVRSAEASSPEIETALLRLSDSGVPAENRLQLTELAGESEGEKRGRILLARARSWAGEGRWSEAATDSAAAVVLVPHAMAAIDAAVDYHRQSGAFTELAGALTQALASCPDSMTGPRAALLSALGDVQMNHLDQLEEALDTFRLLRTLQPENVSVLENLLSLYDQFDDIDPNEALDVASELVRLGALGEELLRTLQHVHLTADNLDGVVQALQVLRLAGSANEKELQLLASIPATLPDFEDGALSGSLYRQYLCPPQLLATTASVITAATEAWLAENPVAAGSGVPVAAGSEVARQFAVLCKAFGLQAAVLRMDPDQTRAAVAVPAQQPVISISADLAEETEAAVIRFELARAMSLCRPEFVMLAGLSPLDALGFFEAALAPVSTQQASSDASLQRVVQRWASRLGPFAPPRDIVRTARENFGSVGDYRQAMETIAIRSAVVASFESAGGFQRLVLELDEMPPRDVNALRELCDRHGSIRALVTWVLSDRYLQLRRELGLVIGRR